MSTVDPKNPEEKSSFASKLLTTTAYAASAVSGLFVTDLAVRVGAYKNWAKNGFFDELQSQDKAAYKQIFHAGNSENGPTTRKAIKNLIETYRQDVREVFRSKGLNNSFHFWDLLTPNQKTQAIIAGITVSGIALGAILTIINSKSIQSLFSKDDEKTQYSR